MIVRTNAWASASRAVERNSAETLDLFLNPTKAVGGELWYLTVPRSGEWCSAGFEVSLGASSLFCWGENRLSPFRCGVNLAHSRAVLMLSEPCSFWDASKQIDPCFFCQVD